ncbi:AraC-like ligand-binding domain-containing protein [Sphaerisporangium corydalis]|uniref:Helix-turn-helix domain-containing protein n=1 Tax=Sphaerisporangium corydalis TaxID=1441875 RepID=A0ABV9EJC4_9ACTN|nr:helix-turn-helix domain-containing protein [Sphaerisporangium corydalis]
MPPYLAQTANVPSRDRRDFWRSVVSDAFVPLEASFPAGQDSFQGRLSGGSLGALKIYSVDADAHVAHRTSRLVTASPGDCYKLGLQVDGGSVLSQDGREAVLAPGDFSVYDTTRPYTLAFGQRSRFLVLIFPRAMLGLPPDSVGRLTATTISGTSGLGGALSPFLLQIGRLSGEMEGLRGVRLAGNVLDLLTTAIADRLEVAADPESATRALFLRVTAFIEARLGDGGLAPGDIAAAHHISTRYLHKLFHAEGTTVSTWIRDRRLEHCGHDLRDPLLATRSVSAIAAKWGYFDASHFSRIFKTAFGTSPRDYRCAATARPMTQAFPGRQALCAPEQDAWPPPPR